MGSIISRKRKDGTLGFRGQIVIKRQGKVVHREMQTFDRMAAARAWIIKREAELAQPGALDRKEDPTLGEVIDRYVADMAHMGDTKTQVLRTLKQYPIAAMRCSKITSPDVVAFAKQIAARPAKPQTVRVYLSNLSAVFKVAKPLWGYPLDQEAMQDALVAAKHIGVTGKSNERERRPTFEELDKLLDHFGRVERHRSTSAPMSKIVVFALFSARRQSEITRIAWVDYQQTRVLVRDMKHPSDKAGNDTWVDLPPEAAAIIESMPRTDARIFPYGSDGITAAFTRACKLLQIDDLTFHDLRHEGISRLFEMGRTIPQVAAISGHRTWQSLQRYTHLRQVGDKYENWEWKTKVLHEG